MIHRHPADSSRQDHLDVGKYRVRVIRCGDRHGLNFCLVHDGDDPLIEWWDMSQDPGRFPLGQMASSYYLSTMLAHTPGVGLDLAGGVAAWKVTAEEFSVVFQQLLAPLAQELGVVA